MAEVKIPQLETDLKGNRDLLDKLMKDPRNVLLNYGVQIDDDASERMKKLLDDQIGPGSKNPLGPGPLDTQAIFIAIKI